MSVIAVTGASGSIGSKLVDELLRSGHSVVKLMRGEPKLTQRGALGGKVVTERHWAPDDPAADLLADVDAVIHLAGEPIFGRFTAKHKRKIMSSRVGPTRRLAELSAGRTFISASAIGYYGHDREEPVTESAAPGEDFLAAVCVNWEQAARVAKGRSVQVRTGLVMSGESGLLAFQAPLFKLGLGGPLGDGQQLMSWISLDDLVDVYVHALEDDQMSGPVNAVAPQPETNLAWAKAVGRELGRPVWLRVPSFAPALLLGAQGNEELALASQNVVPAMLEEVGFQYRHPTLAACLAHEL